MIIDNSYFLLFGPIVIFMPTGRPTSLSCSGFLHFTVQICWKIVGVAWSKQVIKKVFFFSTASVETGAVSVLPHLSVQFFGIPNSISQTIQNWSLTISRVFKLFTLFPLFSFPICFCLFVCLFVFVCSFVCVDLFFSLFPGYLECLR